VYHVVVIRRLYIHNYRCLENLDLPISGKSSLLLIGKNGSGKTTVGFALEVLQKVARGANRVGDLVKVKDFARGRTELPMRFEIEVELESKVYAYTLAFELPELFKEPRVLEERLTVNGQPIFTRNIAQVVLARGGHDKEAKFSIDWHLVALPIVQQYSDRDPISVFKRWLAQMIIIRPVPSQITGNSDKETLWPNRDVTDFGAWFSGLLALAPSAYSEIDKYLKQVMPDLKDIKNPSVGVDSRSLMVQFSTEKGALVLPFEDLSDGEKCFMISALVLATNSAYGSVFCFWDEPDNYLAIQEVGHFTMALRKAFRGGGQFIATSHNPETIRRFSDENTLLFYRRNHLEPTVIRPISELKINGDLVSTLITGDLEI